MNSPLFPRKMQPAYAPDRPRDYFSYNALFLDLNATLTKSQTIEIDGDSDFELIKITVTALTLLTTKVTYSVYAVPTIPVQIVDNSTARAIYDDDMDLMNMYGNAKVPFIFPQPHPFRSGTSFTTTITNPYSGTDFKFFCLTFHGAKVYP
jgi:hypothetical protein